jgi:hypothetical protein
MKKLLISIFIMLLIPLSANAFKGEGLINVRKATIRQRPSRQGNVIDYLPSNKKINILDKKGQWYRITYEKDEKEKKGWVSASLIRLIEKSQIKIEFKNINERFKKYFTDNLLFLDRQLKSYDLKRLKLVISYSSESGVARMTLVHPFDKKHYDDKKTKEMTGSFIDFMVYNDYLWGLVKYKKHVADSVERESMDDYQAIMSFITNLSLLKDNNDNVLLSGKFSGDYVVFNPYIDVDFSEYDPFRVFTPDEESVENNSVFYLPRAKGKDGKLLSAALLYNFFDLEY